MIMTEGIAILIEWIYMVLTMFYGFLLVSCLVAGLRVGL